jgi:parallel beta-helix repeat protein
MSDGNGIIIDDGKNTQNGSTLGAYKGRALVANNISFGNSGSGIHSYFSERVDIINNTAYMNNQTPELDYGEIFANASGDVTIMNNILVASPNKAANTNWNNTSITYDYNVIFGGSTIAVKGPHDVVLDPQFIAPSLNHLSVDFRLKWNGNQQIARLFTLGYLGTTYVASRNAPHTL